MDENVLLITRMIVIIKYQQRNYLQINFRINGEKIIQWKHYHETQMKIVRQSFSDSLNLFPFQFLDYRFFFFSRKRITFIFFILSNKNRNNRTLRKYYYNNCIKIQRNFNNFFNQIKTQIMVIVSTIRMNGFYLSYVKRIKNKPENSSFLYIIFSIQQILLALK